MICCCGSPPGWSWFRRSRDEFERERRSCDFERRSLEGARPRGRNSPSVFSFFAFFGGGGAGVSGGRGLICARGGILDGTALGACIIFGGVGVWLAIGLTGTFAALITLVGFDDDGWGVKLGFFGAPFAGFSLRRFFFSGVSSLSLPAFTPVSSFKRSRSRSITSFSLLVVSFVSVRRTCGYSSSSRTFSSCSASASYSDGSTSATVMDLY